MANIFKFIKELREKFPNYKQCDKCKHQRFCDNYRNDCRDCEQYAGEYHCKCSDVEHGEKCEYFKPFESEGKK